MQIVYAEMVQTMQSWSIDTYDVGEAPCHRLTGSSSIRASPARSSRVGADSQSP